MTLYAGPGTLEIVSTKDSARSDAPGTGDNGAVSGFPCVSSDGRYVAFLSSSTDLVLDQSSANAQVFLRDRTNNTTQLLSGTGGSATTATGTNSLLSISGDGRFVAFLSTATDLVSPATTGTQVFLYDRLGNSGAGSLTLVSHKASSPTAGGTNISASPMISRDGSTIVFTSISTANDLVSPYATGTGTQGFRYDVATGAITLATPKNGAVGFAQGIGGAVTIRAISDDGRWIGFTSSATNAISTATATGTKFFLFDSLNGTTRLLNRQNGTTATAANGAAGNGGGTSSDGRYVTFLSAGTDLISGQSGSGNQVFLYDRVADTITLISHSASDPTAGANAVSILGNTTPGVPVISNDGRFVVFGSAATNLVSGYTGGIGTQFYLYDRLGNSGAGSVTLITHTTASATVGSAGGVSLSSTSLSSDGSRVVFVTSADDLVAGQTNTVNTGNVYAYTTSTGVITFVSGTAADSAAGSTAGGSFSPVLSDDGTFIAFRSIAGDLAANDTNGTTTDFFGSVQPQVAVIPGVYSAATASGTAGTAFSYTIIATNTPTSYSLVSGTLPTGVTVNTSTGVVSGTPTQSGSFNVTLGATNTGGTGSLALTITLAVGVPTVTAISPTTGTTAGGTSITLTGSYFMDATDVKFGAVSGTSLTVVSDSSITVISPAGSAGAVDLTVTTPGGTSATHSGDSFTYVAPAEFTYATNNGEISITGYTFIPLDGVVVIPDTIDGDPVTSIAANAFDDCTSLTSVTIPASVTSIGESAFDDCTNLISVTIGNGVTSIGDYAFVRCTGLTSVTIPASVISVGNSAFEDCSSLISVTIGNGVTSIGDFAFVRCTGLTSVTIPDSVISVGNSAFEECSGLTSVTIGSNVSTIGDYAFANCTSLTSAILPDSATTIGDSVFAGCTSFVGPVADSVDVPSNDTYGTGQNLDFTLHYLENMFVTGTPSIGLTIGSTARTANYLSGSGTHHLRFRYTIQAGESDTNGIASASIVTLNGGTIQNLADVNAVLMFGAASTSGVLVDTLAPQVVSVTRKTPTAQSLVATTVVFEVTFSEDISGLGANSFAVRAVNGGSVTGVIASITGGPRIYAVTVNLTGGTGNFRLEVITAPPLGATEFASGFSGAFAMTSDAQGNLYVPVTSNHSIRKIAPDGSTSTYASSTSLIGLSGMAFNSAGDLYVTNSGNGNLYKVTTTGVVTLFASGFSIPAGLAIDTNDNIYVANSNDGVVKRITPLGVVSTFATGLGEPRGLAFDGAGNLFVGDINTSTGNKVRKVTPDGTVTTFATGISTPYGLVFDSNGTLYVTAAGLYKVSQVTTGGVVSPAALAPGYPTALAFAGGTLHMLEYDTGKVSKLTPAPVADLAGNEPTGLPFTTGQIYTRVTPAFSSIVRKTPPTSVLAGNSAVFEVTFSVPVTGVVPSVFEVIAINGSTVVGTVSSVSGGPSVYDVTVEITSGSGDFRLYGGTTNPIVTTFASGFSNPTALAFDGAGDLYVANYDSNTVSKVTSGGIVSEFASGFAGPTDLVFDSQGILYVTNNGDGSLRKVMSDGSVSTFVTGFAWPVGLAVDGADNIYVSASDDNAVWIVANDGSATVFASGFNTPNALAFDSDGNLYVANQGDNSVSKVTSDGSSWSSVSNSLAGADGLAFDSAGTLYVTNNGNNTVSSLTTALVQNVFAAGISAPTGLAIDSQGRFYVASQANGTITRLEKPGVMTDLIGVPLSGVPYTVGQTYTAANDPATATNLTQNTGYGEDGGEVGLADIVVSDTDAGEIVTATLTLSASASGSLSTGTFGSSTSTYDVETGIWTVTGTTTDVNAALAAVAFTPASNYDANLTIATQIRDTAAEGPTNGIITLTGTPVNDTPILADTVLAFDSVAEDAAAPVGAVGQLVSAFTGGFSDVDGSAGIAITGVNANGSLWYSTDNGATWVRLTGTVSGASALMLYADATTRIYFKPAANFNGTVSDAITFRAWDRTGSANGTTGVTVQLGLTLVGSRATGNAADVTVVGNQAYMSDGNFGLVILNISNPASPTLTGSYVTAGSVNGVVVSGNYAYLAKGASGLVILNISNPASPTLVGTCDTAGTANGVTVSGNYAYIADDTNGLVIINITNPASPTLVGSYNTTGNARYVAVSGSRAFVADYNAGLVILDVSNPASPTLLGSYDTPGLAFGVAVSGNYAYVADHLQGGLLILDISNPAAPTLTGSYDTPGYAIGVTLSGNYAYVADLLEGLSVIDVSNPAAPTLVTKLDTAGTASAVAVVGNYAYVADGPSGLQVMSLPSTLGFVSVASDTAAITITAVNDAPILTGGGTLGAVSEDAGSPAGVALNTLGITSNETADAGTIAGYAIVANPANASTEGVWQYSTNSGTNWHAIGTVNDGASALVLSSSTLVRFLPAANFNGTPPSLSIRALDANVNSFSASGATETRVTIDTTANGGATFISAATSTISTNITAVNDTPTGADKTVTMNEDTAYTFSTADFGFSDFDTGDTLNAVRIDSVPAAGSLTLSGGTVTASQIITAASIGNLVFTPVANASGVGYASFTFSVRDQSSAYDISPNTITADVTFFRAAQAVVSIASSASGTFSSPYTATATGGNGTGALVWALGTGSTAPGAAIDSSSGAVISTGTGTVIIHVRRAADSDYLVSATTADFTITLGKAAQSTLSVTSSSTGTFGSTYSATHSGGSGTGAVTWSLGSGSTAVGAVITTGGTVSSTGTGTMVIKVTKAADSNYVSATSAGFTITLNAASQATLSINSSATGTFGSAYTATATGGSGTGALGWALSTGSTAPGAAINSSSGAVSTTGAGTVVIKVTKASDTNYNAATSANFTTTLVKATATIILGSLSATYDSAIHAATATTTPSSLAVGFTYDGSATAPTNAGSYAVVGTIASANYQGSVSGTLTVAKATPTITWATPSAIPYGTALSGTQLNAAANIAGAFSYNPAAGAVLNTGAQTLYVTFTPSDLANYNGNSAQQSLIINLASGAPLFIIHPASQSVEVGKSVTFTAMASGITVPTYQWQKDGTNIVGATGSSYAIASVISGDAGSYTVVATNSVGTATSNAAVLTTFIVAPGEVVISFTVE